MAISANATYLTALVNPQVLADMVAGKLTNKMVFAPVTTIDRTLEGRPGSVITLPAWNFIGEAATVNEGADIPITAMTKATATATIHKLAKGVQLTDEAVLSGYGDPLGEAANQIALAIDGGCDSEIYSILHGISSSSTYYYTCAATTLSADDINNALIKFGEELDGVKYLYLNPADYAVIRKTSAWLPASELSAEKMVKGVVGEIYGCLVIVSNKLTSDNESFIVREDAFRTYMKREVEIEADRDIISKSTVITGDMHEVNYLYRADGAIRMVKHA